MYTNKSTIDITATVGSNGGAYFLNGVYLSSTEDNATLAWLRSFNYGVQYNHGLNKTDAKSSRCPGFLTI